MPKVTCPTCGTRHEYNQKSPFRPFCSERCKLIDLGAWSQESYRIPVRENNEDNEDSLPSAEELDTTSKNNPTKKTH